MKLFGGLSFGLALSIAALAPLPAAAGPFGSVAGIGDLSGNPIVDVQARRRVVNRNRSRNRGNAAAGALIGAAIIGGAVIANSQRSRRQYYVDDGYYGDGPYYGGATGYVVQQPQPYYGRVQRNYYRSGGSVGSNPQIIYTPDKETPYTYAPAPGYQGGYRGRQLRDPAGGANMK